MTVKCKHTWLQTSVAVKLPPCTEGNKQASRESVHRSLYVGCARAAGGINSQPAVGAADAAVVAAVAVADASSATTTPIPRPAYRDMLKGPLAGRGEDEGKR